MKEGNSATADAPAADNDSIIIITSPSLHTANYMTCTLIVFMRVSGLLLLQGTNSPL
jgi:hypothetical protein